MLVPVTITDPMDRLVIGLEQDNFQVFDSKQPQEIKHFSSEDTPLLVGGDLRHEWQHEKQNRAIP